MPLTAGTVQKLRPTLLTRRTHPTAPVFDLCVRSPISSLSCFLSFAFLAPSSTLVCLRTLGLISPGRSSTAKFPTREVLWEGSSTHDARFYVRDSTAWEGQKPRTDRTTVAVNYADSCHTERAIEHSKPCRYVSIYM